MIKTIIFDLNQVLVTDDLFNGDFTKYEFVVRANLGVSVTALLEGYKKFANDMGLGLFSEIEFWTKVLSSINAVINVSFCSELFRKSFSEVSGIKELLHKLKSAGFELIVLAGDSAFFTMQKMNDFGFNEFFDGVYSTADFKLSKNDELIYGKLLNILNRLPNECLFIDDLKEHVNAAVNAGINSILFSGINELINSIISNYPEISPFII